MATRCTQAIKNQFTALGLDAEVFCEDFESWKSLGAGGEYESYLFGKDGGYSRPPVGAFSEELRHVHLVPLLSPKELSDWNKQWRYRSRKVSNRVLVYMSDPTHGHLLIYILDEPLAHEIADMHVDAHRTLMMKFAKIAERFLMDGKIIA